MKSSREMRNNSRASNSGVVVTVRGSVVDMRFDAQLPPIYSLLRAGEKNRIVIEVLAQLDAHRVRGIALTPTQGLARGMAVEDSGGPLQAPVGKGILARMFDVFGNRCLRSPLTIALGIFSRSPDSSLSLKRPTRLFSSMIRSPASSHAFPMPMTDATFSVPPLRSFS